MKRHTTLVLTGVTLFGWAIAALPHQVSFAQSSSLIGTWKLNLDKSKYPPGLAPRSTTLNYTQDGQNIRNTTQTIDAQGNAISGVLMHIYDGLPHPSTGAPDYDASAYTRVDANTLIVARFKAGKLIAVGTIVISSDGKTMNNPTTGLGSGPGAATSIAVFDKQ